MSSVPNDSDQSASGFDEVMLASLIDAELAGDTTEKQSENLARLIVEEEKARAFYVSYIHDTQSLKGLVESEAGHYTEAVIDTEFLSRLNATTEVVEKHMEGAVAQANELDLLTADIPAHPLKAQLPQDQLAHVVEATQSHQEQLAVQARSRESAKRTHSNINWILGAMAAMMAIAAGVSLYLQQSRSVDPASQMTFEFQTPTPKSDKPVYETPFVRIEEADFEAIDLASGARVTIRGLAAYRVVDDQTIELNLGRLVGYVPEGVDGLVVKTANATITDLGTKFLVRAYPGNTTDIHVIEGEVQLTRKLSVDESVSKDVNQEKPNTPISLVAGQSRRVTSEENIVEIKSRRFGYLEQWRQKKFRFKANRIGDLSFYSDFDWLPNRKNTNNKRIFHSVDSSRKIEADEGVNENGYAIGFNGIDSLQSSTHDKRFEKFQENISVSFWFRSKQLWVTEANQANFGSTMVAKMSRKNSVKGWCIDGADDGKVRVRIRNQNQKQDVFLVSQRGGLNDGEWHHVVWTRGAATGINRIFIDGHLEGEIKDEGASLANDKHLTLGGVVFQNAFNHYYEGSIDELALFGKTLSPKEVHKLFTVR